MPLDSSHTEFNDSAEINASLSDQNVAILYEIVQYAENHEQVNTFPFRAIFAAYEHVLPQYGLDSAHDQIYLRFLFRLRDKSRKNEPLFQSFLRLLRELGIQIEFNNDEDAAQRQTKNMEELGLASVGTAPSPRRLRRASFNSIYDAEDESTKVISATSRLRPPFSDAGAGNSSIAKAKASVGSAKKHSGEKQRGEITRLASEPVGRGLRREDLGLDDENPQHAHQRVHMSHEPEHKQRQKSEQARPGVPTKPSGDISLSSNTSTSGQHDEPESQSLIRINPRERLYNPSRTQLLRDAETFQYYRIRLVTADIIEKWCDAALKANNHAEHLHRIAVARDTEVLVRQAFEHWRARLHARKQAAQIRQFYAKLEKRAEKARDLYLLIKAFTHWAQSADDENFQRCAARQQTLGIKCFHAWRSITVENQNKVHNQGLKKFFGVWEQHCIQNWTSIAKVGLLHQEKLVRSAYRQLFWSFCERRAPEWHVQRLKQRIFLSWTSKTRRYGRQSKLAANDHSMQSKFRGFRKWVAKARQCQVNTGNAMIFNHSRTILTPLRSWSRGGQFAPLAKQISNIVDWRVAGSTFALFVNKFRYERQAEKLDQFRILRFIWTRWNDRLRWQTLRQRVDDRVFFENLYKWMIACRYLLLRRLHDQRIKRRFLRTWTERLAASKGQDEIASDMIQRQRRSATLRKSLAGWLSHLRDLRWSESVALEFYSPKISIETLGLWKSKVNSVQEIINWVDHARVFFLERRFLRVWSKAVHESRRRKRREAYIQVRRKSKIRLASDCLQDWRLQTSRKLKMDREAMGADQQRLLRFGTKIFDIWKNAYELVLDQGLDASEYYENSLLRQTVHLWNHRVNLIFEMEETALANADLYTQKAAFTFLRKISLRIIESRAQQGKVERLKLKHERRHFHDWLRKWREITAARQNRPQPSSTLPARTRKSRIVARAEPLGATRRAEEWTELDTKDWTPTLEAQTSSTPLPGYLSTPSRRAARARSMAKSTTPTGTPFQNRLRAELNTTPGSSRQTPFSRSTVLRRNNFGAILEDSPGTARSDSDE